MLLVKFLFRSWWKVHHFSGLLLETGASAVSRWEVELGHADTNQLQTWHPNIIFSDFHFLSVHLIQCDHVDSCSLSLTNNPSCHTYSSICCCPPFCTLQSCCWGKGIGKVRPWDQINQQKFKQTMCFVYSQVWVCWNQKELNFCPTNPEILCQSDSDSSKNSWGRWGANGLPLFILWYGHDWGQRRLGLFALRSKYDFCQGRKHQILQKILLASTQLQLLSELLCSISSFEIFPTLIDASFSESPKWRNRTCIKYGINCWIIFVHWIKLSQERKPFPTFDEFSTLWLSF